MANFTPSNLSEACSFDHVYGSVVRPHFDQQDDQSRVNHYADDATLCGVAETDYSVASVKHQEIKLF
ncbi:hypothetical protein [Neolewinella aurantiaca]|uniref:hypothetical protein n=1 Tax=Neolewinella aurantiaca TaxID=2602767 RepID=UPI00165098D7|nr:hypothetical protein [Neolewinella aurantiaca]